MKPFKVQLGTAVSRADMATFTMEETNSRRVITRVEQIGTGDLYVVTHCDERDWYDCYKVRQDKSAVTTAVKETTKNAKIRLDRGEAEVTLGDRVRLVRFVTSGVLQREHFL